MTFYIEYLCVYTKGQLLIEKYLFQTITSDNIIDISNSDHQGSCSFKLGDPNLNLHIPFYE